MGRILAAQIPDLPGAFLAHLSSQIRRAKAAIEGAHHRPRLAKNRIVCRDGQIANDVEDVSTTDRVTGNERDDRLGHRSHVPLKLEHVEPGDPVLAYVPRVAAHLLVSTSAERPLPVLRRSVAREENNPDIRIFSRIAKRFLHFKEGVGPERVAHLRAIEGDARGAITFVIRDVLVRLHLDPFGLRHLTRWLGFKRSTEAATPAPQSRSAPLPAAPRGGDGGSRSDLS